MRYRFFWRKEGEELGLYSVMTMINMNVYKMTVYTPGNHMNF